MIEGRSHLRSPELWFGIFAAIALPDLLSKIIGIPLQYLPVEQGPALGVIVLVANACMVAFHAGLGVAGFVLRDRYGWAPGLMAGSLLQFLGAGAPMLLSNAAEAPWSARLWIGAMSVLPEVILLAIVVSVMCRVRLADYVAVALLVGANLGALGKRIGSL